MIKRPARGFANVETWVFDLDNTLYPHHLNLWQQVDAVSYTHLTLPTNREV